MISAATGANRPYRTVPVGETSHKETTDTICERDRLSSSFSASCWMMHLMSLNRKTLLPSQSAKTKASRRSRVRSSWELKAAFSICTVVARSTKISKHSGANSEYSTRPSALKSTSLNSRLISFLFKPTSAPWRAWVNSRRSRYPLPSTSQRSNTACSPWWSSSRVRPWTKYASTASRRASSAAVREAVAAALACIAPISSTIRGVNSL
mmetsp:Transcript_22004/g.54464  ORF Transcript_22004/g.54464 Transcript_22004/m.54464 type:complete len:209 (-) Transcript_22004:834-1460(-)